MNSIDKFEQLKQLKKLKVAYHKELMKDSFSNVANSFSTINIVGDVLNVINSGKNIYNELTPDNEE